MSINQLGMAGLPNPWPPDLPLSARLEMINEAYAHDTGIPSISLDTDLTGENISEKIHDLVLLLLSKMSLSAANPENRVTPVIPENLEENLELDAFIEEIYQEVAQNNKSQS